MPGANAAPLPAMVVTSVLASASVNSANVVSWTGSCTTPQTRWAAASSAVGGVDTSTHDPPSSRYIAGADAKLMPVVSMQTRTSPLAVAVVATS